MTTPKPAAGAGNLCTFNIQHGFAEALLRGMRSSFLSDPDYHHLTQCETLDDVRLNLTETDYADALADTNSLTPNTLQKAAVDKVRWLMKIGGLLHGFRAAHGKMVFYTISLLALRAPLDTRLRPVCPSIDVLDSIVF